MIGPVVFVAALALLVVVALRCSEIDEAELVDGPVDARDLRGVGVALVEFAVSVDEFVEALNTVATSIERFRDLSDVHVCRPARRPELSLHAHGIAVDVSSLPAVRPDQRKET